MFLHTIIYLIINDNYYGPWRQLHYMLWCKLKKFIQNTTKNTKNKKSYCTSWKPYSITTKYLQERIPVLKDSNSYCGLVKKMPDACHCCNNSSFSISITNFPTWPLHTFTFIDSVCRCISGVLVVRPPTRRPTCGPTPRWDQILHVYPKFTSLKIHFCKGRRIR